MSMRLCLLLATTASAASSSSAAAASPPLPNLDHDIYTGTFTSSPREDDLLHAIQVCDTDVSCAGVSLERNGTIAGSSHTIVEHTFVGPYLTPKTYATPKPYTYHRGKITEGTVLGTETGLTLKDAKLRCTAHYPTCVAFTYPVWSLTGLNHLPNVTFVSTLEAFAPSPDDEWRTYVSNDVDRVGADRVNGDVLPYDAKVRKRPYRGCCNRQSVPAMAEIEAADTLERISCDISREEFFLRYEVPRRTVMLVGCEKNWSAATEWTYEKLAPRFSNSSKWRARLGTDSESYSRVRWEKLANAMRQNKPFYVFDQLKDDEAKSIEDDFDDPVPMRGGNLYSTMNARGIFWAGPLRWFCIGRFGSGTRAHVDPFASDAWNTLIRGHKWWVIYPEGVTDKETTCEGSCSDRHHVREWTASVGVNAARNEYGRDQFAVHALQRPGETIYVPDGIVHSVFNMDSTIAITRNYGSAANLDNVWKEACTSGDDRKWKIMYNLVLNKEQRRRVRKSRYWPFSEHCKEEEEVEEKGSKKDEKKGKHKPHYEINDVLYDEGWWPTVGDVVEARYEGKHNEWYKGTVTSVVPGRYDVRQGIYDVTYDDGDTDKKLPRKALRKYKRPKRGEILEAKMINKKKNEDVWVLAVVTKARHDGTVDVMHFDGDRMESVPLFFVRRSDWRYAEDSTVEAVYDNDGWFKGTVTKARSDGTYDVEYDDGDFSKALDKRSIRFLWASKV